MLRKTFVRQLDSFGLYCTPMRQGHVTREADKKLRMSKNIGALEGKIAKKRDRLSSKSLRQ